MTPRGRGSDPDGKGRSFSSGRIPRRRGILGANAGSGSGGCSRSGALRGAAGSGSWGVMGGGRGPGGWRRSREVQEEIPAYPCPARPLPFS